MGNIKGKIALITGASAGIEHHVHQVRGEFDVDLVDVEHVSDRTFAGDLLLRVVWVGGLGLGRAPRHVDREAAEHAGAQDEGQEGQARDEGEEAEEHGHRGEGGRLGQHLRQERGVDRPLPLPLGQEQRGGDGDDRPDGERAERLDPHRTKASKRTGHNGYIIVKLEHRDGRWKACPASPNQILRPF